MSLIQDSPCFQNNSANKQMAISPQLAITLFLFSHFGSAASVDAVAQWAGCSTGAIVNSTHHVIRAFLLLHDQAIRWPNADEKQEASDWVGSISCHAWRPGYCMVNGTLIPLVSKPGHFGEQFFDHKSNYSLSLMVSSIFTHGSLNLFILQLITLPNFCIIDYVLGPPGSVHDSTAFKESHVFKELGRLFHDGEWLWADSVYTLLPWCIMPYKRPQSLVPYNCQFNYHLSTVSCFFKFLFTYIT